MSTFFDRSETHTEQVGDNFFQSSPFVGGNIKSLIEQVGELAFMITGSKQKMQDWRPELGAYMRMAGKQIGENFEHGGTERGQWAALKRTKDNPRPWQSRDNPMSRQPGVPPLTDFGELTRDKSLISPTNRKKLFKHGDLGRTEKHISALHSEREAMITHAFNESNEARANAAKRRTGILKGEGKTQKNVADNQASSKGSELSLSELAKATTGNSALDSLMGMDKGSTSGPSALVADRDDSPKGLRQRAKDGGHRSVYHLIAHEEWNSSNTGKVLDKWIEEESVKIKKQQAFITGHGLEERKKMASAAAQKEYDQHENEIKRLREVVKKPPAMPQSHVDEIAHLKKASSTGLSPAEKQELEELTHSYYKHKHDHPEGLFSKGDRVVENGKFKMMPKPEHEIDIKSKIKIRKLKEKMGVGSGVNPQSAARIKELEAAHEAAKKKHEDDTITAISQRLRHQERLDKDARTKYYKVKEGKTSPEAAVKAKAEIAKSQATINLWKQKKEKWRNDTNAAIRKRHQKYKASIPHVSRKAGGRVTQLSTSQFNRTGTGKKTVWSPMQPHQLESGAMYRNRAKRFKFQKDYARNKSNLQEAAARHEAQKSHVDFLPGGTKSQRKNHEGGWRGLRAAATNSVPDKFPASLAHITKYTATMGVNTGPDGIAYAKYLMQKRPFMVLPERMSSWIVELVQMGMIARLTGKNDFRDINADGPNW